MLLRFSVSTGIVEQALHLPESAYIMDAEVLRHEDGHWRVRFVVDDRALPPTPTEAPPVDTTPSIREYVQRYEWSWNL